MNENVVAAIAPIIYVLIGSLLSGVSIIVALGVVSRSVLNSPVIIKFLETLANSLNPDLLASLNWTAQVVEKVTDGIPEDQKDGAVIAPSVSKTVTTMRMINATPPAEREL